MSTAGEGHLKTGPKCYLLLNVRSKQCERLKFLRSVRWMPSVKEISSSKCARGAMHNNNSKIDWRGDSHSMEVNG